MKTILLSLTLLIATQIYSQDTTMSIHRPITTDFLADNTNVPYIVGSAVIPGYDVEIRTCPNDETVTLSNGRKIAGLSCIIIDKSDYIGGLLIFAGDTTKIVDVLIEPLTDGAVFTVKGEKFNMNFTLYNGSILKLEDEFTIFNTEGKGIWTIIKKRA